jgi:NTE family protein
MKEKQSDRLIGIALSGGAARCISQIGVLEMLEKAGIGIDAIAGTSGGSFVGALYASGRVSIPEMKRLARGIKWHHVVRPNLPRRGLISSERIYRYVSNILNGMAFEDLKIPLAVVASDLRSGDKVVIDQGSVARAVQASCSLPVIFTPTTLNGRLLVDGGAASQLPVLTVKENLGAKFLIGVDVNCNVAETARLNNLFQIGTHFVALFARRNAFMERKFADIMIEVDASGVSLLDLDKADLLMERGRQAAQAKLDQIVEKLEQFKASRAAQEARSG